MRTGKQPLVKQELFSLKATGVISVGLSCRYESIMLCRCSQPWLAGRAAVVILEDFEVTKCRIAGWISDFFYSELLIAFHLKIVAYDQNVLKV